MRTLVSRLIEIELRVRDVEASLAFYRLLGVRCGDPETHGTDTERHVHATWGSWGESDDFLMLNLYPARAGDETRSRIGFASDDLDALHEQLQRAQVTVVRGPERMPWGRTAEYRDPDGNVVSLTERPKP